MTFTLKIELGNDAMQTGDDVNLALKSIFNRTSECDVLSKGNEGSIRDLNGNSVGSWEVK
jgi:hypothetical protein